jgi:glycerate dehydrogenase
LKIIVLDGYALNPGDLSWEKFKELGDVTIFDRTPLELRKERSKGADILITNKTNIDKLLINELPNLKYIGVLATGYNVVDIEGARNRGIVVTNIPSYSTNSVAQMTFALILELCNHAKSHSDAVKCGTWSKSKDFCFWNHSLIELSNKKIGIIGFGNIGKKVAHIATAFGMNILALNRSKTDESYRKNFIWTDLNDLLQKSDIVTLHCPLTAETKGLINRDTLKLMKRDAFLINTSRGGLIIEEDLAEVLNKGKIAGAGLDVLTAEPPERENPLLKAKNCIITPHISWATRESRIRLMEIAIENIKAFISGKPINVINK